MDWFATAACKPSITIAGAAYTGQVLKDAQAVGFRSVMFYSSAGNGGWWFDISGPTLPNCDVNKRLCL